MASKKLFYTIPKNSDRSQINLVLSFHGKSVDAFKKRFYERFNHYLPEIYFTKIQLNQHLAEKKSFVFTVVNGILLRIDN